MALHLPWAKSLSQGCWRLGVETMKSFSLSDIRTLGIERSVGWMTAATGPLSMQTITTS